MSAGAYINSDPSSSTFLRQTPSSPLSARSNPPGSSSGHTPFRAPAHKHAHHLHSIPPREKSTRTLIIDHLLWVHARTRFAQARAELGMADRTGGTHSPNYVHRERPENYEEDEDVYSEGEDVTSLTARAGGPGHTHEEDEDERLDLQDLALARSLRQRSESVEKVIAGMLNQPPSVPPVLPEELLQPPTSPQLYPQTPQSLNNSGGTRANEHMLPNGVRLRLALGTVINDVFARRPPAPPSRHASSSHGHDLPPPTLPSVLIPLAAVSLPANTPTPSRVIPNEYIKALYNIGADPDSQNSPPALRCPRHLLMGCEICVEAKAPGRPTGEKKRSGTARAGSTTASSPGDGGAFVSGGNVFGLGGGVTGWQEGSGIGSGLARPGPKGTVLRRPSCQEKGDIHDSPTMRTKLAELVVRFLRLSALVAIELGRETVEDRASLDGERSGPSTQQPTVSPLLTARSLASRNFTTSDLHANALRPTRAWYFLLAGFLTRCVLEGYMTGGWRGIEPVEILLNVGLGLPPKTAHDSPRRDKSSSDEDPFQQFDPDDLPELEDSVKILFPSLRDINPARGGYPPRRAEGAEQEYEVEMRDRLARFYDVPHSTPDVATHMEDLAWQYPAEAVERAACRFCEAVARWRGKPELETYKKAPWIAANSDTRGSGAAMSIDSLVHSNPTSPSRPGIVSFPTPTLPPLPPYQAPDLRLSHKPIIDDYFAPPPSLMLQGRKRRRSEVDRPDDGRRLYQMFT